MDGTLTAATIPAIATTEVDPLNWTADQRR